MTNLILTNSGVCEMCGDPATVKVPIYKAVKHGRANGRITTGKWAYSCFGCLPKVERMTTIGVNR